MTFVAVDNFLKRSADQRYEIHTTYSKDGPWHFVKFEGRRIGECSSMAKAEEKCREHSK